MGRGQADPAAPIDVEAVEAAIALLDRGEVRVAEPAEPRRRRGASTQWAKQAVLLYFRVRGLETTESGPFEYHDRLPLKHGYAEAGVRVVPPATVRYGAHIEPGAVLMPSYVNIGAWVGAGTMVDTWATVGSCAQIGADVHLAGGVGIGGVLEPVQAAPVVIEDGAFIGSRCIVVEGVHVGRGRRARRRRGAHREHAGDRSARQRARRVPRPGARRRDRRAGLARPRVPGRHLRHAVRAHHRRAHERHRRQGAR